MFHLISGSCEFQSQSFITADTLALLYKVARLCCWPKFGIAQKLCCGWFNLLEKVANYTTTTFLYLYFVNVSKLFSSILVFCR